MDATDHNHFEALKKAVEASYVQAHPSCDSPIEDWKGQDISNFQEELIERVNGRISEKWFYTHIKSSQEKLPREDMLDLLSRYAGFESWRDFKHSVTPAAHSSTEPTPKSRSKRMMVVVLGLVLVLLGFVFGLGNQTSTHSFCFVDADRNITLHGTPIEVTLLFENESPKLVYADSNGCFAFESNAEMVRFAVKAQYYKPDTITRRLVDESHEDIALRTDDYALMLHIISTSNVEDWKQRKRILNEAFADDARIIQVYKDQLSGMELYNKREFINKLTLPLNGLKNIEVLDVQYSNGAIASMRFMQLETAEEK